MEGGLPLSGMWRSSSIDSVRPVHGIIWPMSTTCAAQNAVSEAGPELCGEPTDSPSLIEPGRRTTLADQVIEVGSAGPPIINIRFEIPFRLGEASERRPFVAISGNSRR